MNDLAAAVAACVSCAQVSTSCADACVAEDDVASMRRCITLDLNCADLCDAVGRVLSRGTESDDLTTQRALEACIRACVVSAEECEKHAGHHEHCRVCAETTRDCVDALKRLLGDETERELQSLRGG